jgi:hypothetical protein
MGLLAAVLSLGRASSFLPYRPTFLPALTGLPIRRHYIPPWLTKDSFLSVGPVSFVPKSWRHFGMTNGNDRTLAPPGAPQEWVISSFWLIELGPVSHQLC